MDNSDSIRGLRKCDLGGVIFSCTCDTIAECHLKQLFGLPSQHISYVRNIEEGLPLFLFNDTDRKIYGLYVAVGRGQLNIDPYAWTNGGFKKTPFAAQVVIRVTTPCHPLEESEYKKVILDNYYDTLKFRFELDHAQTRVLTALFKPSQNPINFRRSPTIMCFTEAINKPYQIKSEKMKNGKGVKLQHSDEETISDWEVLAESRCSNSNWNSNERCSNGDTGEHNRDKESVLVMLRKMAASRQRQDPSSSGVEWVEASTSRQDNALVHKSYSAENSNLLHHQAESAQLTARLKQTIEQSHYKISNLRFRIRSLESTLQASPSSSSSSSSSTTTTTSTTAATTTTTTFNPPDNYSSLQQFVEQCLGSDNVIYLVGGNNGNAFLSDFDSFSPSLDVLTSLRSMSSAKSYVGVTAFDGRIYVAGGYDGSWFDTVECYDRRKDEWTPQPSLTSEKGCLSGVSIDGKIFMLGGKNSVEFLSEVDMLDPALGRCVNFIPMLEKRSTFGTAAIHGSIYAVGGYDGKKYLITGERLDIREPCWKKLPKMNSRRGCHSLAVLNDKIYAVGGYDGTTTTSTVECYDPRMPRWMMTEPMNCARGYVATAVLGGSLYAIGGIISDNDLILDTVECYQDGSEWRNTGLKAIGKRCCSAIVL